MSFKQETKLEDTAGGSAATIPLPALSSNVAIGDVVAGWLGWDTGVGTPNLNTVTDNLGNSYTIETRVSDTGNQQAYQQFRGIITVAGACSITGNLSVTTTSRRGEAAVFDGLVNDVPDAQAAFFDISAGTGTDGVSSGASGSTTQSGDLVWGGTQATSPNSGNINAGTGYTALQAMLAALGRMEYKVAGATQAETVTFTQDVVTRRTTGLLAFKSNPTSANSGLLANKFYPRKNFGAGGFAA